MKKTYIHPEMEIVKMDSVQLLLDISATIDNDNTLDNDDQVGSRFDDFWG